MIEVIQCFRTRDGGLFDSREAAERREADLELEEFVNVECYRGMDQDDVLKFIKENRQKMIELLK